MYDPRSQPELLTASACTFCLKCSEYVLIQHPHSCSTTNVSISQENLGGCCQSADLLQLLSARQAAAGFVCRLLQQLVSAPGNVVKLNCTMLQEEPDANFIYSWSRTDAG